MNLNRLIHWLLSLTLLMPSLATTEELQHWLAATPGGTLRGLAEAERNQLRTLFAALLATTQQPSPIPTPLSPDAPDATREQLVAKATAIGMSLRWIELRGVEVALLAEQAEQREGRGAFAFRVSAAGQADSAADQGAPVDTVPVLLQTPHRFADLKTGELSRLLFTEHPFNAAAWSTVHRNRTATDGGSTDLSRRDDSALIALSRSFARTAPDGFIVQLHGFGRSGRRTAAGHRVDLILSNGTRSPDAGLQRLFNCLSTTLDAQVMLYPWDVAELGATRNPVGRALRAQGHTGFRHLELSRELRQQLLEDADQRAQLARCLLASH